MKEVDLRMSLTATMRQNNTKIVIDRLLFVGENVVEAAREVHEGEFPRMIIHQSSGKVDVISAVSSGLTELQSSLEKRDQLRISKMIQLPIGARKMLGSSWISNAGS